MSMEKDQVVAQRSHFFLRAALLYLSLPAILFGFWWLNWVASSIFCGLIVLGVLFAWKSAEPRICTFRAGIEILRSSALPFAILLVWCALSGTGGIGFQNSDYGASNALLKDLVQSSLPLYLRDDVPLVYYVLYYLPAASVGKLFGWPAANLFLFVWTYFGLLVFWGIFSLAVRIERLSQVRQASVVLLFIFFGGWDYFGSLLTYGSDVVRLGTHIEWWASIGQFSSNTTLLFWVPQHIIAPWIAIAVILLTLRHEAGCGQMAFIAALSFLWSPIASLGLLPFLLIRFVQRWAKGELRVTFTVPNLVAGPFVAVMGALYYSSNSFSFPSSWQMLNGGFMRNYVLMTLLETVTVAAPFLAFQLRRKEVSVAADTGDSQLLRNVESTFGWVALLVLLILPAYWMGIMNDLCMRASAPALVVLFTFWVFVIQKVYSQWRYAFAVTTLCALLGSGSAVQEICRSLFNYSAGVVDIERVSTLLNHSGNSVIEQRAGRSDSPFWRWLGPR